jgi:protoporphyrin/coproporphyrin ferrochelatase
MDRIGVLVMAYGGPNSLDEVEPYLQDVRNFRPTPAALVEEIRERYARIGGRSPILERTRAQADALSEALNAHQPRFRTVVGMRHWHPYIDAALEELAADGIDRAVGLVMAPHYSRMSIGAYFAKVGKSSSPVTIAPVESWHLNAGYLDALAERVRAALMLFPEAVRHEVPVIFTAHSLPERILEWNDPYPEQLLATVHAVMERLEDRPHRFAYQSAAMTPDPWLGPDAGDVIEELASEGIRHVLIAPIGFVCEHVEILYDIEVEFAERAAGLGVQLERIEMLDTAPPMIEGLADVVRTRAAAAGWL